MLFGRDNDALKEIKRTVELDLVSLRFNAGLGKILFFLRQYNRAKEQVSENARQCSAIFRRASISAADSVAPNGRACITSNESAHRWR